MKIGTDGVLLGAWADVEHDRRILDIGSGSGLIALMVAQRNEQAMISGIDIDPDAVEQANENASMTLWSDRLHFICQDVRQFKCEKNDMFDHLICNPPFYQVGSFKQNPDMRKTIARHEVLVKLEDVIKEASLLLNTKGVFALIHRPERLSEIIILLNKYRLEPKRLRFIYPKMNSKCNHILVEAVKDANKGSLKVLPPLYIYDNDDKWTCETLKIYNYETEE